MAAVQTAVKVTVEDSVKEQFKSYSDVIQENVMVCQPESPSITPTVLKEVVQSMVQQEDCSRNSMVFGITEEESEDLPTRVQEVFQHIGFKPTMEVCGSADFAYSSRQSQQREEEDETRKSDPLQFQCF